MAGGPVAEGWHLRWQVKALKAQVEQTCWRSPGGHPPEEAASHSGWQLLEPSRPRGLSSVQAGESRDTASTPAAPGSVKCRRARAVSAVPTGESVSRPVRPEWPWRDHGWEHGWEHVRGRGPGGPAPSAGRCGKPGRSLGARSRATPSAAWDARLSESRSPGSLPEAGSPGLDPPAGWLTMAALSWLPAGPPVGPSKATAHGSANRTADGGFRPSEGPE